MQSPEAYLRARGLEPLAWEEILRRVEQRLKPGGVESSETSGSFARLHRAFTAYPTVHTCRAFYDFIARKELYDLLACHRFSRLQNIAEALEPLPLANARLLDVGAGAGYLAGWLRDAWHATVHATDLSPATGERLAAAGFPPPPADAENAAAFDWILCADSLGEIHADEDDWLSDPANAADSGFAEELEARYGLGQKLAALRPLLAPGGTVLLFEPVPQQHFWHGAARLLEAAGWRAEICGPDPVWGLVLRCR